MFANQIDKKFENNCTYYKTDDSAKELIITQKKDTKSVEQKIKQIFASPRYIYRAQVEIVFPDKKVIKKIIGRNEENLITIENEQIKISDIQDIYFKD